MLTVTSDTLGFVQFDSIMVNKGGEGKIFELLAELYWEDKNVANDTGYFEVGNLTDFFNVFYADVDSFVFEEQVDACSGERVRVTVRATLVDPNKILTSRNNEFKISFDKSGLAAYSSEDATTPITKSKLVNGEAVIWIGTSVREISNAKITITPIDDNTIGKGERNGINFEYCSNQVKSAFYFADNGNGSVNRIEVTFNDALDETNMPDSMKFYWPDLDPHHVRVFKKEQMKVDTADAKKMVFILKEPFDSLTTSSSNTLLGECIRFDAAIDKEPDVKKFNIKDKVGPLLMSAVVVERINAGNDIMHLTFSEPVTPQSLDGEGLLLIKGKDTITLKVLNSTFDETNTRHTVTVEDLGDKAPKKGDLLRINPEGAAKDMAPSANGDKTQNFAHEKNRPVTIELQEIPPEIVEALYYDRDGNGVVDTVVIEFNKAVKLENIEGIELSWGGKKTGKLTEVSQGGSVTKVAVNVVGKFNGVNIKTSEIMNLTFNYKGATVQVADVKDKAAPVITRAVYHPGAVEDGKELPDTLEVIFSEKVKDSKSIPARPFIFTRKSYGEYKISLEYFKETGNTESTVKFLVKEFDPSKIRIVETGDSIKIRN
ncbi:MAG: hypothetical protein Q4F84_10015, partial [Fibrobacter sp.]|nr:hypothetical protein [Fibrobacter sp.]